MISILAHLLGMLFVLSEKLWIGGLWFGFLFCIPKQAFVTWLSMRDALSIGRKLLGWDLGLKIEIIYFSLVGLVAEFKKMSWGYVMCWIHPNALAGMMWFLWVCMSGRGKPWKPIYIYICILEFGSSIYNIWRTRNALNHGNNP